MPLYRVYGAVTGTKYLGEYDATSAEEAEEKALAEAGHVSICHHCSNECSDPEITDVEVVEVK